MGYLLDANTIIGFLKTGHRSDLESLAAKVQLSVAEDVRDEVSRRNNPPPQRWWERARIAVQPLVLGSKAHTTLLALGIPSAKGLGERASIAIAAHDDSLTFVTSDKNAMWIAIRELRGQSRVESLASFLFSVRPHLPWRAIDDVYRESQLPQPTWWATWRAGG